MKKGNTFEQFLQDNCNIHNLSTSAANTLRKVGGPTLLKDRTRVVDVSSSMSSVTLPSSEWDLLRSLV